MRIISGEYRGIKLHAVRGKNTRPTSDKIKESLFNIIGPYFSGGKCLDLFAGSGNLGLEALSRGLDHSIFIERHPSAIKTIQANIKKLRVENKSKILRGDAFKRLKQIAQEESQFTLIFLDPPYDLTDIHKFLEIIVTHDLLTEEGLVIYEHESSVEAPNHESLFKLREAKYGTTAITIYKRQ